MKPTPLLILITTTILSNTQSQEPGFIQFTKVTEGPVAVETGHFWGAAWVDYDQDGWIDLFVAEDTSSNPAPVEIARNRLYRNRGDGSFAPVTDLLPAQEGMSSGGIWADYDNDDDLDLFVPIWTGSGEDWLYRHLDDGSFERIVEGAPVNEPGFANSAAWADYNNDGWVDLFVAVFTPAGSAPSHLYRNLGDGQFMRDTAAAPAAVSSRSSTGVWGDYDGDGDPDIYIVNNAQQRNRLYRNDGNGQFQDVTEALGLMDNHTSQTAAWADADNDRDLDLFVANSNTEDDLFFRNDGEAGFSREIIADGRASSGLAWGDFDNDGDLDLYVSNVNRTGRVNHLYENIDGTLQRETLDAGPATADAEDSVSVVTGDFNNDGFLDLFVTNGGFNSSPKTNSLYRNSGNENRWILIRCVGLNSNRAAIGATVRVRATIGGTVVWQMREISGGGSWASQHDLRAHFGLGDAETIDEIRVEWPAGGIQRLHDVASNQILSIMESPTLTVTPAVMLTWSVAAEGYLLESAPSLDGPWTPVEAIPEVQGNQTRVTVPATAAMRLFRLRMP